MFRTYGILATDSKYNISFIDDEKNRKTISHSNLLPISSRNLDYNYLKKYLKDFDEEKTMIVIGDNTKKQMKNLLEDFDNIITSNEIYANNLKGNSTIYYDDGSLLKEFVYSECIKHKISCILVLGGRSVFKSFKNDYSKLYFIKFNYDLKGNTKVKPKDLKSNVYFQFNILNTTNMSITKYE